MINKRFLVPVLAFVASGLPAGASIVPYCNSTCGSNTIAAFTTQVANDAYASVNPITFSGVVGVLTGNQYTDDLTQVLFQATHNLTDPGSLDTQSGAGDTLIISIPAVYTVVLLDLTSQNGTGGFCIDNSCDFTNLSSTPTTIGYINTGNPSIPWTITISPFTSLSIAVNDFNVAGPPSNNSDTPEVGTMILIGVGLISMRWMKRWPRRVFRIPQTA
jgi:hypothetical protein